LNTRQFTLIAGIALLGVVPLATAGPAAADPGRQRRNDDRVIEACITEIRQHADYSRIARALYWVMDMRGKNLVETEVHVEASLRASGPNPEIRNFAARCVVGHFDEVVEFRLVEPPDRDQRAITRRSFDSRDRQSPIPSH
jgi:hypothetical protein